MFGSFSYRNATLIASVCSFHILIVLLLLAPSPGGRNSNLQGVLVVSLTDGMTASSKEKASQLMASARLPANNENQSKLSPEASSAIGAQSTARLGEGVARQIIHNPKPHYPLMSRRLREQGLVVVRLCVNEQGVVGEADVSKSSGFQSLDQSALNTLMSWRFSPSTSNALDGLSQCFQTPVQFSLEG